MIREAQLYQPLADARVRCTACARYCDIPEGKIGLCGVRQNIDGKLDLLVYGQGDHRTRGPHREETSCPLHARVENILDSKGNGETEFLRKYVGIPDAGAIFETIQEIRDKTKIHIEITDLVIPEVGGHVRRSVQAQQVSVR